MRIYPLLRERVSARDWAALQSNEPHREDPVSGERTSADYERLHRQIEDGHS